MLNGFRDLGYAVMLLMLALLLGAYGRPQWYMAIFVVMSALSIAYIDWRRSGVWRSELYQRLLVYAAASVALCGLAFVPEVYSSIIFYLCGFVSALYLGAALFHFTRAGAIWVKYQLEKRAS